VKGLVNDFCQFPRDTVHRHQGYRYAHDEEGGFAAGEKYLPEGMPAPGFYRPVQRGLELKIAEKMASLNELNQAKATKK
jgi:putative ATPase